MTKKWGRLLLIWAAFLLLIGLIGCVILFGYLKSYEKSRPEPVMDELISTMTLEDFISQAGNNCDFDVSEFEDGNALYQRYISESELGTGKITYRQELGSSDRNRCVFSIRSGLCNLAQVTLAPDQDKPVGFGRHEWKVSTVSSGNLSDKLSGFDTYIFAPSGKEICINGLPVSEAYLSHEKTLNIPSLSKYEDASSLPVPYVRYDIGKIYGEISVTDESGTEVFPSHSDGGSSLYYMFLPDTTYSVTISAPEDVTVYINGVNVPKEEAELQNVLFKDLEEYTAGSEFKTAKYAYDGFLGIPTVTAKDEKGCELIPAASGNGRYTFLHANSAETEREFSFTVEDFFRVYKNYATAVYNPETMGSLLNRTLRHSELYDYFLYSQDAYIWTPSITTEYESQQIGNFSTVGEDCFVCSVDYQMKQTAKTRTGTEVYDLDHAFELVFVRSNDMWLCARMEAISD